MSYMSLIDKFKILFDMILDFKFIFGFVGILLVASFLYLIKRIDTKKYILTILSSVMLILIIDIVINYKELSLVFDNFMTIFFSNIYFPSIYVYIVILVVVGISFIVSVLNRMLNKIYKIINGLVFIMNSILFVIVLNIVAKNNIDVFTPNSLYTNINLVAVLEISTGLFIVWILLLLIIYTTSVICDRIGNKKVEVVRRDDVIDDKEVEVVSANDVITHKEVEVIEDFNTFDVSSVLDKEVEDDIPLVSYDSINDTTDEVILDNNNDSNSVTFDDILNGMIPVNYYDNEVDNDEYTIVNPQELYENKYYEDKKNSSFESFQDIANDINDDKVVIIKEEKKDIENIESIESIEEELDTSLASENKVNNKYTIYDYKKFANMLDSLKKYTNSSNISIDEAVTISLINNYSIDDCLMFKEILEDNLLR